MEVASLSRCRAAFNSSACVALRWQENIRRRGSALSCKVWHSAAKHIQAGVTRQLQGTAGAADPANTATLVLSRSTCRHEALVAFHGRQPGAHSLLSRQDTSWHCHQCFRQREPRPVRWLASCTVSTTCSLWFWLETLL